MFWNQFFDNIRKARAASLSAAVLLAAVAAPLAQAQTLTVLHAFSDTPDGGNPNPLIRDAQGNLYGTTAWGGAVCGGGYTCGTVFKLDSSGNETVLYRFTGGLDGANSVAALVQDAAGNLYGTTRGNGSIPASSTIFKVDTSGHETVLFDFHSSGGCCADSPLALDAAGNLYGTSPYGGDFNCGTDQLGCGTVYRLTQSGNFSVLHTFTGADGTHPDGGLVRDTKGNLYGGTYFGGDLGCVSIEGGGNQNPPGCGVVFELRGNAAGSMPYSVLHTFTGQADGSTPLVVIQDPSGNLYGLTNYGGDLTCYPPVGCGTIFKLDTKGNFTVLFTFTSAITRTPYYASQLVRDSEGNLYGAKQFDGANNDGFLFKLDTKGNLTDVFDFPPGGSFEGSDPVSLLMDSAGNFYGSLLQGGRPLCGPPNSGEGCGTVFELTTKAGH